MNYTYVLRSEGDGRFYTGSTSDLDRRLRQHAEGRVRSTAHRTPFQLIYYYEAGVDLENARRRERFLKTGRGKRCLRKRLAGFLAEAQVNTKLERH